MWWSLMVSCPGEDVSWTFALAHLASGWFFTQVLSCFLISSRAWERTMPCGPKAKHALHFLKGFFSLWHSQIIPRLIGVSLKFYLLCMWWVSSESRALWWKPVYAVFTPYTRSSGNGGFAPTPRHRRILMGIKCWCVQGSLYVCECGIDTCM